MKKIFFLGTLALAAAGGGIYFSRLPSSAREEARPLAKIPAASAVAPQRAPASAPSIKPKSPLAKLQATKACYESEDCAFPQTDPHSYTFAVGKKLASQLQDLQAAYAQDSSLESQAEAAAQEMVKIDDGFVQEEAIKLFSQLPPNSANVDAMLSGLKNSADPLVVAQAMKEWERYLGTGEEARIQEFLADFIAHGAQFSSEKASELILPFLNERSLPSFEQALASMIPNSTQAKNLKALIDQYKLQRQGA